MPRKTKLTPALQTAIANAVQVGVPLPQAAVIAGVGVATVQEWLARGLGTDPTRPQTPLYASFAEAITRARAVDELRRLARLEQAGRGGAVVAEKVTTFADGRSVTERTYAPPDWRADAFYLERSRPERWGRKVQADLTVNIPALAAKVAREMGLEVEALMAEAQALLREGQD